MLDVVSESYHMVAIINVRVNRMTRRLEGNAGNYGGGENVSPRGTCELRLPMRRFPGRQHLQ
jgi:hypothetical protein